MRSWPRSRWALAADGRGRPGALRSLQHPQRAHQGHVQAHTAAYPGARVALTGWNAYSRIDAVTGYPDSLARLYIDSDAWTGLHRWDGDVKSVEGFRHWFRARPFSFTPQPKTLVIGPGGGSDVLVALARAASAVTAGRDEPADAALRAPASARGAGHLYDHPRGDDPLARAATTSAGPTAPST